MISTAQIAWLAGLLEGEGWFRGSGATRTPQIGVAMTDRDVIERAAALLGATVCDKKVPAPNKPQWSAVITGEQAVRWMFTLHAYMGLRRRAKIVEVLAYWRSTKPHFRYRTHCPKGHEYTIDNVAIESVSVGGRRKQAGQRRHCRTCGYLSTQRWFKRNPEKRRAYEERYRLGHPEKIRAMEIARNARRRKKTA